MTQDDKFSFLKLISILIGFLGVILIFGIDSLNLTSKNFIPKVAIIVSALGYVLSSILAYNLKNIDSVAKPLIIEESSSPQILLFAGVNGAGKTTTIAKIASQEIEKGKKVLDKMTKT